MVENNRLGQKGLNHIGIIFWKKVSVLGCWSFLCVVVLISFWHICDTQRMAPVSDL